MLYLFFSIGLFLLIEILFRITLLPLFLLAVARGYQWSKLLSKKQLESKYSTSVLLSPLQLLIMNYISDKIALNVNADEAAVLGKSCPHSSRLRLNNVSGAALHGASLSRQFKTKNIKVSDIGIYDIQASYPAATSTANPNPRTITTLVFAAGSKAGTKKVMTFKRKEDFTIHFDYKTPIAP